MKPSSLSLGMAILAMALPAVPADARIVQLLVKGTIVSGADGGTDFEDVNVINNVYVETFVPGSFFGTIGSLDGKSVEFRLLYDTTSPSLPVGDNGVFSGAGDWAYTLSPVVTVDGVAHDVNEIVAGTFAYAPTAEIDLIDGTPDKVSGKFTGLTFSGNTLSDYRTSAVTFAADLPGNFLSTDALLPGSLAVWPYGFAHRAATGTGSFVFSRSTCFLTCSYKSATATFTVSSVDFGAIPEPASWMLLVTGFAAVGVAGRRRGPAMVTA